MSGSGSGRYAEKYGYTVEDCLTININEMFRQKWIEPGKRSSGSLKWTRGERETGSIGYESRMDVEPPFIRIHYMWRKAENRDYRVYLTTTYPFFGGKRYWFFCPHCDRRIGKLYNPPNTSYFLCRSCQNLTYTSCRESHQYDVLAAKIAVGSALSIKQAIKSIKNFQKEYSKNYRY
jgi:hypothetical protein